MISIFHTHPSPRLTYIANQVFNQWLHQEVLWYTDVAAFEKAKGIKINYSEKTLASDIHIVPAGLLAETGIQSKRPELVNVNGIPVLFPSSNGSFPFDFFSAAFWMLSRMEEYEFEVTDRFQRFSAKQSLAHLAEFLEIPVVDAWIHLLLEKLPAEKRENIHTDAFRFICTIDVDNAYAIYGKPYWRQILASVRDVMRGKPGFVSQRWKIWRGKAHDPYDTYAFLEETSIKYRTPVTFFYLLGDYSKHDKNLTWNSDELKKVVNNNLSWSKTGIHPSFYSYSNAKMVLRDVQRLKEIAGVRVSQSRQHYLRCRFPFTFQYLLEAGIRTDFTLGFHDLPGYRAGTGRPFYFYDLTREMETELVFQPFAIMDGTFHDYMKITPEKALEKTEEMFSMAKKYGTPICTLWHNDTVNDEGSWKGWRKVFLQQFEWAK